MKKNIKSAILQTGNILLSLIIIGPIIYAISVSFMESRDILSREIHILPSKWSIENYIIAFNRANIWRYLFNSFVMAGICGVSRVIIGSMAAYSFVFFNFKMKNVLFFFCITTILVPQEVIIIQNYVTVSNLGLINTFAGLCSINLINAASIFILRQALLLYPKEIPEAAKIDGCNTLRFYITILLPTIKAFLFVVFLSSFVSLWNTYLWPLVITNNNAMRSIQVGITMIKGRDSPDFGPVMAALTVSMIPMFLLFYIFIRQLKINSIEGINS